MKSSIEWTQETWNPVTGCTRVSAGCDHCYAVSMTRRLAGKGIEAYQGLSGNGHFNGVVKCHQDRVRDPLKWRKPRQVFVNSMSDLFHRSVPFEFIDQIFEVMENTPHTYQVLTKRPDIADQYISERLRSQCRSLHDPAPNIWIGTSCETDRALYSRGLEIATCPAKIRFLSLEPLLGPVQRLGEFLRDEPWLGGGGWGCGDDWTRKVRVLGSRKRLFDWVIVGGESGPGARVCQCKWIRQVIRDCRAAAVPCFVKQLGRVWAKGSENKPYFSIRPGASKGGDIRTWPRDLRVRQMPPSVI